MKIYEIAVWLSVAFFALTGIASTLGFEPQDVVFLATASIMLMVAGTGLAILIGIKHPEEI